MVQYDVPDRQTTWMFWAIRAFIALAVARWVHSVDWPGRNRPILKPIYFGQHSLEIFFLGIFLSFLGHFVPRRSRDLSIQILISA